MDIQDINARLDWFVYALRDGKLIGQKYRPDNSGYTNDEIQSVEDLRSLWNEFLYTHGLTNGTIWAMWEREKSAT